MDSISDRWRSLNQHIEKLQQQSLLATQKVTLIAVAKGQTMESIKELLAVGQRVFAENHVQEAKHKWPQLLKETSDIRLHLIGSLQTNKVKEALTLFDAIQTVDRKALVDALLKYRAHTSRASEFFIQVNTGEEEQKGGVYPKEAKKLLDYCRAGGLPISGLMCVPSANAPAAPHFALLYTMAQEWGLPSLSMGMSGDYETAIRLGATHVRIGTALFGPRD